jgi:hypothetical protein
MSQIYTVKCHNTDVIVCYFSFILLTARAQILCITILPEHIYCA